jgi:predicted kinase
MKSGIQYYYMNAKLSPTKPFIIMLYGFPGSGKTTFARLLSEEIDLAHIQADKIVGELLGADNPNPDQEKRVAQYMTREFLRAGVSVIYDASTARIAERRAVREVGRLAKAPVVMVWLQIDPDTAFMRTQGRDRRKAEDKFATTYSVETFQHALERQQNPTPQEDYIVISGKHTFHTQRAAVMKKLYEIRLIDADQMNKKVVKPGLVNLVPNMLGGRGEVVRRNISIR